MKERSSSRVWPLALVLVTGIVMAPRVASAITTTIVQLADGQNPALLAKVDKQGNVATSNNGTGFVVTQMKPVTVGAGATKAMPMKPVSGGHLTVFVVSDQPGSVTALECVNVGASPLCAPDLTGAAFAGDGQLHQAVDDDVQGTMWQVSVTNTGSAQGTFTLVVVDRPVT